MDRINNNSASIGCRIKYVRQYLNLTQGQFSEPLGITPSHISRLEHGIGNISITLVKLISKVYVINEEWILTGNGEMIDSLCANDKFAEYEQILKDLTDINNQISKIIHKMRIDRANSQPSQDE